MENQARTSRFEHLKKGYSEAGLPMTTQRRALLEVLAGRLDHPTVDQLHAELTESLPEVSKTTVYRSLEVMEGIGLLQRVEHPGAAVRFDPNTEPHHHFVCTACGSLTDLPPAALKGAGELQVVGPDGGVVEEISVMVRGRCAACST